MALDLDIGFPIAERQASTGLPRKADTASSTALPHGTIPALAMLAHMTCLWLLGDVLGGRLTLAQTIAAIVGNITLYAINAGLFYRLHGPWRWYLGLLPFLASCSLGIACSVLLATWLASMHVDWFVAGLCGAAFGLWRNQGAVDRHGWSSR